MFKLSLVLTILVPYFCLAIVDMKNANFTDQWVDGQIPGKSFDLEVKRNYNSRSLFNGMLGFGWCTDFETSLEKEVDGSLRIKHCGDGTNWTYYPGSYDKKDQNKFIDKVLKAHKAAGNSMSTSTANKFKGQLESDPKFRAEMANKYNLQEKIKAGLKYYSQGNAIEFVVFKGKYYERNLADGTIQHFDIDGNLTKLFDKNGNSISYTWSKGLLTSIKDSDGRQLVLKHNATNKVISITGPSKFKISYSYKGSDLTAVTNAWNNAYTYTYDRLHNLTKISYPDKTSREITYDINKDWVTTFKDRKNCKEEYKYETDPKDPRNHYWSTLVKKCGKKVTNKSKFEFWYKQRNSGEVYLSRAKTEINGVINDIVYHNELRRPVKIVRDNVTTYLKYYNDGRVKQRSVAGVRTTFSYDKKCKKVSKVVEAGVTSKYDYDKKCNLSLASNTRGQKVQISNDRNGRIKKIVDQARRTLLIDYKNRFGKPSTVTRPGVGSIQVAYDNSGNIKKVNSTKGPTVAIQVATTFNNLLEIIRPAGVQLGL